MSMKVICDKLPSNKKKCIATIGGFDGVHKGHQFILKKVKTEAKKRDSFSLAITFTLPPRLLLKEKLLINNSKIREPFLGQISDFKQKISSVDDLGVDFLWFLKTSSTLLELSPHSFIEYILDYFDIRLLIVGSDFRFGHKGKGDVLYLRKIAPQYNFKVLIVKKLKIRNKVVSSSAIRNFIKNGNLEKAKEFLGRNFCLKGKVLKGKGIGLKLGFPTANIDIARYIIPVSGVYAAFVLIGKKLFLGAVNIGKNPTLTFSEENTVEVHIINFNRNILNSVINVVFLEKIRNEHKFSSFKQLQLAIKKDILSITAKYSIPSAMHPQAVGL